MDKNFFTVEDIVADEGFQSWYLKRNDEKRLAWEAWMVAHPEQAVLVAEAREYMDQLSFLEREVPENQLIAAEHRLMASINSAASETTTETTRQAAVKPMARRWWWAAAAVFLLALSGILFWQNNPSSAVQTAFGEIREQQLPDGSKVMLNANSEIRYTKGWEKGAAREVWLKGEAFFHVMKTPNRNRFIVHTNQFDIVVTGTQFNVVNRAEKTNVMLTEGSVQLHTPDGQALQMKPGDFVEFNNKRLEKLNASKENILAWRDRKLYFDKTPLPVALATIEEHYGVSIKLGNTNLNSRTLTGILANDSLEVVLQALEALEYHVTRKDKEIIISD